MSIRKAVVSALILTLALTGCVRLTPSTTPPAPAPDVTQEVAEPVLPLAQQQAVLKAESYLAYSAFSRTGLIGQLEYEGFTNADAAFGVDYLNVDWNAQAALKAQSYLDFSSFSRQGLIDQLIYEGFTAEEAEFGVAAVGY